MGKTSRINAAPSRDTAWTRDDRAQPTEHAVDWRRKMSDNIAYALLTYTGLQIFMTIGALKSKGTSLLPYLALIILVGAIIPACRRFERRWNILTAGRSDDPALARYFRRDRMILWACAIGLPFGLTALFKGLAIAFN